ncbi:ABC transporter permease [Cytobacillus sp. FJAT-53684]|uniref:ABC transporter permease n=1 Tax=Cytobacillus mangrovibacter TaxID=3299024 RepID=A0ABW6K638_9BACI
MEAQLEKSKPNFDISKLLRVYGTLIGLIILILVFSILSPSFFSYSNALTILRQISMLMIISTGLTVVMITKKIDLSIGYVASAIGVLLGALIVDAGMSMMTAVIIALVIGAIIGCINGFFVAYMGIPDFIATLGIGFLVAGLNQAYTHGHPISGFPDVFGIFGSWYLFGIPTSIFIMAIFLLIIHIFLYRARNGRYIHAIGSNEEATMLSGVNTKWNLMLAFIVCGIGAALTAVVLTSHMAGASPTAGEFMLLDAIAVVFLGGTAFKNGEPNLAGTLVGALIIGVLVNGLTLLNVPYYFQDVTKGILIILAVSITSLQRIRKS